MSTSSVSTCKTSLSTSCIPTGYILVRSEESAKADLVEAKSLSSVEEDSKEKKASVVSVPKSLGKIRPKGSIKVKLRSYAQMIYSSGGAPMVITKTITPSDDTSFSSFGAVYDEFRIKGVDFVFHTAAAFKALAGSIYPMVICFDHNSVPPANFSGAYDYDNAKVLDWQAYGTHTLSVKKAYVYDATNKENILPWQPTSNVSAYALGTFGAYTSNALGTTLYFYLMYTMHAEFRNRV